MEQRLADRKIKMELHDSGGWGVRVVGGAWCAGWGAPRRRVEPTTLAHARTTPPFHIPPLLTPPPSHAAVAYLGQKGYVPAFGARPVKRVVQQELETALAKGILRGEFGEEDTVVVEAPGGAEASQLVVRRTGGAGTGAG